MPSIVRRRRASCHRPRRSSAAEPRHRHRHQWSERRSPRANLSAPVAPVMFFTLLISHCRHAHCCCDHRPLLSPPLPTHKHPDKRCDWTAADGPRHEMNGGSAIDRDVIDGKRRDRWMAEVVATMGAGGRRGGRRRRLAQSRWATNGGGEGAMNGGTAARSRCAA